MVEQVAESAKKQPGRAWLWLWLVWYVRVRRI